MASIEKRPNGKWRARWREYPGGPQRTKQFGRKADAEAWLVQVQSDLMRGSYVDPAKGRTTVETFYRAWFDRQPWRESSRSSVGSLFENHVLPTFGPRPLGTVRRGDIEAWAGPSSCNPHGRTGGAVPRHHARGGGRRWPARGESARHVKRPKVETAPVIPFTTAELDRAAERGAGMVPGRAHPRHDMRAAPGRGDRPLRRSGGLPTAGDADRSPARHAIGRRARLRPAEDVAQLPDDPARRCRARGHRPPRRAAWNGRWTGSYCTRRGARCVGSGSGRSGGLCASGPTAPSVSAMPTRSRRPATRDRPIPRLPAHLRVDVALRWRADPGGRGVPRPLPRGPPEDVRAPTPGRPRPGPGGRPSGLRRTC